MSRRDETTLDIFGLYLDDINRYPILTSEEEVALAARIRAGGPDGALARARLIECNARLVIEFAKRYPSRWLRWEDIVAIGNEGLIRAVEKYDPFHDFEKHQHPLRFSTYARWWIRSTIERELDREGAVGRYTFAVGSKVRVIMRLHHAGENIADIARQTHIPEEDVLNVIHMESGTISLDSPVADESEMRFGDLIPDTATGDATVIDDSLARVLATLSHDERIIVQMTYGFLGKEYSDATIARRLGKEVIAIQRTRKRALAKLAHSTIEDEHGRHPLPDPVVRRRPSRPR